MAEKTGDVEKDLAAVTAMGKRLKLTGRDLSQYIHKHMTGFGYEATRTYGAPKSSGSKGGFFSSDNDDDDDDDL